MPERFVESKAAALILPVLTDNETQISRKCFFFLFSFFFSRFLMATSSFQCYRVRRCCSTGFIPSTFSACQNIYIDVPVWVRLLPTYLIWDYINLL